MNKIREYKKEFLITSAVILLPIIIGIILWGKLPDEMPVMFAFDGTVTAAQAKPFAVVGLPVIFLALHALLIVLSSMDAKLKNASARAYHLLMLIMPTLSVLTACAVYYTTIGGTFTLINDAEVVIGLVFFEVGRFLRSCRGQYEVGMKLPWAQRSKKNWDSTHNFAGIAYMIAGVFSIASGILWLADLMMMMTIDMIFLVSPIIYSYIRSLYSKE